MSSAPLGKAPPTKPKKDRERDKETKEKQAQSSERLKTVVRRLPPNLPEEVFWQSVQTWVTDETVTWKVFYPGKIKKRAHKENIPSRAYIAFKTDEQLAHFSRAYDGHIFRDKSGNETQAIVEFSPFQKIPGKGKVDARNATIDKDEDYMSFLESLNAPVDKEPVSLEALIASTQPVPHPKTTPLLEALKAEKSANKDKEAILRNHAHYKDQVGPAMKRDDAKKKGPAAQKVADLKKHPKKAPVPGPSPGQKPTAPTNGKPVKSPRPPKSAKPQNHGSPPASSGTTPVSILTPSTPQVPQAPIEMPVTQSVDPLPAPSAPASRRGRPLIGLGSRHFEAALSGAGVSSGERKIRREREREKQGELGKDKDTIGTPEKTREVPPSPKRNKRRETGGMLPPAESKVSSILQRNDSPAVSILQREPTRSGPDGDTQDAISTSVPASADGNHPHPPHFAGRGARRARGRGRGGSAPHRGG
ncbi:hypothetical protein BDN72DRAFT_89122 [Pluteus cervinus]|uniref:Uncharacterized protein n=1 Tax=Pluteus cervinus TaxID=181527 RepID=A0ACD3AQ35_9AGAR|nr:hypothetical protein BDN72DRAFT_89122 [Pluteus cervinus]